MAFLKKEVLHKKAKQLGLNPDDYIYQELQGLVSKALQGTPIMQSPNKGNEYELDPVTNKKVQGQAHVVGRLKPRPQDFLKEKEIFAPELKLSAHQFFGFEEIVGDQPKEMSDPFSEMRMKLGSNTSDSSPEVSSTPRILSKTGKKVVATTGMPHGNAEIYYEKNSPGGVFSAKFGNIDGYVWSNRSPIRITDPNNPTKKILVTIRGIKDLLEELDRLVEWEEKCSPYQKYAFNIKIIDKAFARNMLRQIILDIKKERKLNNV